MYIHVYIVNFTVIKYSFTSMNPRLTHLLYWFISRYVLVLRNKHTTRLCHWLLNIGINKNIHDTIVQTPLCESRDLEHLALNSHIHKCTYKHIKQQKACFLQNFLFYVKEIQLENIPISNLLVLVTLGVNIYARFKCNKIGNFHVQNHFTHTSK